MNECSGGYRTKKLKRKEDETANGRESAGENESKCYLLNSVSFLGPPCADMKIYSDRKEKGKRKSLQLD